MCSNFALYLSRDQAALFRGYTSKTKASSNSPGHASAMEHFSSAGHAVTVQKGNFSKFR